MQRYSSQVAEGGNCSRERKESWKKVKQSKASRRREGVTQLSGESRTYRVGARSRIYTFLLVQDGCTRPAAVGSHFYTNHGFSTTGRDSPESFFVSSAFVFLDIRIRSQRQMVSTQSSDATSSRVRAHFQKSSRPLLTRCQNVRTIQSRPHYEFNESGSSFPYTGVVLLRRIFVNNAPDIILSS